jgi:lysozyme
MAGLDPAILNQVINQRSKQMNLTQQGLALIRRFEGFRACAYRDAAGIWTIGFGHTSAAGAPHVRPGMKISRKEGLQILARDVASFALGVERLLDVELRDSQFSALVSFAYNVGLGNFRKSSVLGAVNARDFAAVPRRLSLWVKCRGCVLPGLVNRRAAEAAMFLSEVQPRANQPMRPAREPIEPLLGKPMRKSSTGIAAMLSGAAGLASSFSASLGELTHVASTPVFPILAGLVILAAVFWIIRERRLKALEDGV